jgi:hypothetical protein
MPGEYRRAHSSAETGSGAGMYLQLACARPKLFHRLAFTLWEQWMSTDIE